MTALRASQVTHRYGRDGEALSSVSVSWEPGITALLGANGAGKSTLLNILAGGLKPTKGSVSVDGLDPYQADQRGAALGRIALMPQVAAFPKALTAHEFVSYLTWLRGFPRERAGILAQQALSDVGFSGGQHKRMGKLSGGMVRRVWLAQALAAQPEVLLLDEPSTGLDPRQRAKMVELIAAKASGTVVLSSHLLEDVQALATRAVVLNRGTVVFDGPIREEHDAAWLLGLIPEEDR